MLSVFQLAFEYPGKRVLEEISFSLPPGEITALVGPNGAGKTTLLRCLAALYSPFSGKITWQEGDIFENPRMFHSHIGYLADDFGLYDDLTVTQSLILAARRHGTPKARVAERVAETLQALELMEHQHHRASQLSRGLRQRLGIGQAIIHQPNILLLDEPASGLDPEARIRLAKLFLKLKRQGMTLLVSSHILAELEAYSDHMLVLRQGRLAGFDALTPTSGDSGYAIELSLARPWPNLAAWLGGRQEISDATCHDTGAACWLTGGKEAQATLLRELVLQGAPVLSLSQRKEDIQSRYIANYSGQKKDSPT